MPGIGEHEKERAHAKAASLGRTAKAGGFVPEEATETVNEWFARWAEFREKKGLSSVRSDRGRYGKWVAPAIGTKSIAMVVRRDIEEIVQTLDAAVLAKELRWKTACNTWGVITKMFRDATRSKNLNLRARDDNPASAVEGPDRGPDRAGPYLFPSEFLLLMQCDRVPARWKRIFMLTTYLYVRGGELAALDWSAVNFAQGYLSVHQAIDNETGDVKPTKTEDVRKVPLEPTLVPLLEAMHKEAAGEGRVITAMPPLCDWAKKLRKYLEWAGVTRAEVFASDDTRRQIDFHDLRHTGITWRAIRGDHAKKIQRAAGHSGAAMTDRYINEAETFEGANFGEPFPAVPLGLLSAFRNTVPNTVPPHTIPSRNASIYGSQECPYVDEFRTALVELAAA
jgi:integrase